MFFEKLVYFSCSFLCLPSKTIQCEHGFVLVLILFSIFQGVEFILLGVWKMFFWISKSQTSPFLVFKVKLTSLSSFKSYLSLSFPFPNDGKTSFKVFFCCWIVFCGWNHLPKNDIFLLGFICFWGKTKKLKPKHHNDFQRCLFVWRKRSRLNWKRLFLHRTNLGVLLCCVFFFFWEQHQNSQSKQMDKNLFQK